jgi:Uma2 family endonuclease
MSISTQIQHFPSEVSKENLVYKKFPTTVKPLNNSALLDALFDEDLTNEEDPPLESDWHVASMVLLLEIMEEFFKDRTDVYISGNTAVRFDPNRKKNRNFRGPDFYIIKNVPKGFRDAWVTWEENAFTPDFVIELASTSTVNVDLGLKKEIYEQVLKTPEYVIYNPFLKELLGWRLSRSNHYQPMKPNKEGWLWCEEIGLWLGVIEHHFPRAISPVKTPRFFDQNGQLLPTRSENEAQQKEIEAKRAARAEKRAEVAEKEKKVQLQRAEVAEKEKETQTQALRQAEAEIARLRAIIEGKK